MCAFVRNLDQLRNKKIIYKSNQRKFQRIKSWELLNNNKFISIFQNTRIYNTNVIFKRQKQLRNIHLQDRTKVLVQLI